MTPVDFWLKHDGVKRKQQGKNKSNAPTVDDMNLLKEQIRAKGHKV